MFNIPKHCHIRWQAALAVLEDLQDDASAPFNQGRWADELTIWERKNGCGSAACFGGYISVAPYCAKLGFPKDNNGSLADEWLLGGENTWDNETGVGLCRRLFNGSIGEDMSRTGTLVELVRRIKETFKESTGKELIAPMVFWV